MKLEKYENKSKKKRKAILISLGVIMSISVSILLYKTFASFTESAEFPLMNGKVDYFGNSDIYFAFYNRDNKLEEMPSKDNSENLVFYYGKCDNGASVEWDSEEWAPLVKNLSKSKTKCSLYFREYNAADYIKDLTKTDTINLKMDDTNDANIRYVGASPNNYIDIGDRDGDGNPILWRIIGVMNNITNLDNGERQESLIKIVRAESIGKYSWDTSVSGINYGNGVNEWSEADVMKLLNPNTVYSGTPTIGGSLYWNRESGNCYNGFNEENTLCDFKDNGINEQAKKRIAKVRWNTGTAGEVYNDSKITARYMYEGERSSHNGKEQCESSKKDSCNDKVERKPTWDGYIGLMYPSDFGYAVGGNVRDACLGKSMRSYNDGICNLNDWLTPINNSWLITSEPYFDSSVVAFLLYSSGYVDGGNCGYKLEVLPTAYLKSNIKILPNPKSELEYGSIDNPFILTN